MCTLVCIVGGRVLHCNRQLALPPLLPPSIPAFVELKHPGDTFTSATRFGLRWLTPTNEVNLCGHATLATAAALFFAVGNKHETLEFDTLSGTLSATRDSSDRVALDLPLNTPVEQAVEGVVRAVLEATVGDMPVRPVVYSAATKKLLIHLDEDKLVCARACVCMCVYVIFLTP